MILWYNPDRKDFDQNEFFLSKATVQCKCEETNTPPNLRGPKYFYRVENYSSYKIKMFQLLSFLGRVPTILKQGQTCLYVKTLSWYNYWLDWTEDCNTIFLGNY